MPDSAAKVTPAPQGFINGRGAVNGNYRGNINGTRAGAVNGVGMINGKGAINGTGLVNGTGLTNGSGMPPRQSVARPRQNPMLSWKLLVVVVVIVLLIPTAVFLTRHGTPGVITIDGNFDDWDSVQKFGMRETAEVASDVAVYEWAISNSGSSLSMFLRVQGAVMGSSLVDSYYLFVDPDNSVDTGYSIAGIGAEYLLDLDGWNGIVQSAALLWYDSASDNHNWSSWIRTGSLEWASQAGTLEAMANLPSPLDENARYLLLSQNNLQDPSYSISYPVPESGSVLVIDQHPGLSVSAAGTIPLGPDQTFVELSLRCEGATGKVDSITPVVTGLPDSAIGSIDNIDLEVGETRTVNLVVDTSGATVASALTAYFDEGSITSDFDEVIVEGDPVSAYVSIPPAAIRIDGAFGDWIGLTTPDNDTIPIENPDVNITAVGSSNSSSRASFFVSVEGELYRGTYIPSAKAKPTSGGGGSAIPRRQSGEDVLRVFIDSDQSNLTGARVSYESKTIGADYKIEIAGTYGQVTSQSVFKFQSGAWVLEPATPSVAKDAQRIELSVMSSEIGNSLSFNTIIETTDWRNRVDWATPAGATDPWVVDASGNAYQTLTGGTWGYLGTPTLAPGDRIVDIAMGTDGGTVFLVTNTGRTFYWELGTSTSWSAGQTRPIDTATYSEAVSMTFYGRLAAWLLTKNGSYFWLMDATASKKDWTYQDIAGGGTITDFTDIYYSAGTMYALRSGANSGLLYSANGNSFTRTTDPTGSTTPQTEFTYIAGGPGYADDRVFVLCENGDVRYSANGGTSWSSLGNLPRPSGPNQSKYTGLGIDPNGYMWVVTDTGYCYRSADTVNYNSFVYTGRAPITGIVAVIPLPYVPEFSDALIPVLSMIVLILVLRRSHKRRLES